MAPARQLKGLGLSTAQSGVVYLVGAGPGDPGLLTIKGAEILSSADVIVYDRLAHPQLLRLVRRSAECIYVGKASANHAMKQPDINDLLVEKALKGLSVARLKGGDPLVFGRGGEEAEHCHKCGVRFEIIPGVTSAIAAAAYAGIPVTHRDAASSFAVITGHERADGSSQSAAGAAEGRRNWKHISWAADTLIFLMGIENIAEIAAQLLEHGRDPETPVGIIQWGTWPGQRVVTGQLNSIVEKARVAGIGSPAVCVVGEVVKLRDTLRWFDDPVTRPLFGKRILVTRAREQASVLSDMLRALGADPVEFPTITIAPRTPNAELDAAISSLNMYCWLVFTSANAVNVFADALKSAGRDSRALGGIRVAAIGPATALSVTERLNILADYVPSEAVAEGVLRDWPDVDMAGKQVLLPRAAEAREVLPQGLREIGAIVNVVPVYDTVLDDSNADELVGTLESRMLDALTFTSSSTVTNFIKAIGSPDREELDRLTSGCLIAAIGPITAQTLRDSGLEPQIVAAEYSIPGLVAELTSHFIQASAG